MTATRRRKLDAKRVEITADGNNSAAQSKQFLMNPFYVASIFGIVSLIAIVYNNYLLGHTNSANYSTSSNSTSILYSDKKHKHICRDRTIFISDASSGYAREAALLLSQQGFHVLAGVKTESQKKSFIYDVAYRKGLEPIVVDISDPPQLAELLYRIRKVSLDLKRPLYGILINSMQEVEYLQLGMPTTQTVPLGVSLPKSSGRGRRGDRGIAKTPAVSGSAPAVLGTDNSISVDAMETAYRRLLKGPIRLLQAAMQPDMWDCASAHSENTTGRGDGTVCQGMTGRVVLLSPAASEEVPAVANAQVAALHSYLFSSKQAGGLADIDVVIVSDKDTPSERLAVNWVLDLADQSGSPGSQSCINELGEKNDACRSSTGGGGGGNGESSGSKPIDAGFSHRANVLARAFLSLQPPPVYKI